MLMSALIARWLPLALVTVIAVALALLPARGIVDGWAVSSLLDALHLPAAWIVLAVLVRALPPAWTRWQRIGGAAIAVTLLALLVEVVQPSVGRQAELGDLLVGGVGVGVGVGWFASRSWSRRPRAAARMLGVLITLAAVSPALRDGQTILARDRLLPVLFDARAPVAARAWFPAGDEGPPVIERSPASTTPHWRIAMDGPWAGLQYEADSQDWWGYEALAIALVNPGAPVELRLRVDDRLDGGSRARSSHVLHVPSGASTLRVSMEAIKRAPAERTLGLCCIERVHLTLPPDQPPTTIELREIRLE